MRLEKLATTINDVEVVPAADLLEYLDNNIAFWRQQQEKAERQCRENQNAATSARTASLSIGCVYAFRSVREQCFGRSD